MASARLACITALFAMTACYDWSVPPDEAVDAGVEPPADAPGDAPGDSPDADPGTCAAPKQCSLCVACTLAELTFMGSSIDCVGYDECLATCDAGIGCPANCYAAHPLGPKTRQELDKKCTSVCGGKPPCQ